MEQTDLDPAAIDDRIARRLRELRGERGWSLDELARASGVSRASLSRLENGEVGPTTAVLARLCTAYGLTLSRLMLMVEDDFPRLVRVADQPVYRDRGAGFSRRSVSPPSQRLAGEAILGELAPGARIAYEAPPRPGLEHHLLLLEGRLTVEVEGVVHDLSPGDCLRYRLFGESRFETPADAGARYVLFLV